ncbi:glycosyltransferase family 2 protein [Pigmentiphaga soli]|uniref:glycosyltransferase family 2 protein n=1 Tax=Pigmentiphaga soli TaxID=1007095 RepID=UPI0031E84194
MSVIVITRNEAANIAECLASAAFADEWIVVDSGSADDTVALAQAHGARVVQTADWPGFGPQKQRALELATGDWVLSIDADERVTPELAAEIRAALADPAADAYEMPRLSSYCGRFMRHGGWWPDRVLRLFRRGRARFSDHAVHERVIADGAVRRLRQPLIHYSYRDLESVLDKVNRYSTAGAQTLAARGRRGGLGAAIGHGLWAFLRTYLLRRGFLDGRHGFMLAVSNAEVTYYRYVKRMLMDEAREPAPPPR